MGYGRGNIGTGMHLVQRGTHYRRHYEYSVEQLQAEARVRAFLAQQEKEERSGFKKEGIDGWRESPFVWEKLEFLPKEKVHLKNAERVYSITRDVARILSQTNMVRICDYKTSEYIGNFLYFQWSQGDFDFDYIFGDMAFFNRNTNTKKKGTGQWAFLNVNVNELILDKFNSGIQIFLHKTLAIDNKCIDGFEYDEWDGHGIYFIGDNDLKRILEVPDGQKGRLVASLVSKLAVRFTKLLTQNGLSIQHKLPPFPLLELPESPSYVELLSNYIDECPNVIKEFIRKGWSVEKMVKELDEKYWYYSYVEKFLISDDNDVRLGERNAMGSAKQTP